MSQNGSAVHSRSRKSALLAIIALGLALGAFCVEADAAPIEFPGLALRINDHGGGGGCDRTPPGQLIAQEHWRQAGHAMWRYEGVETHGNAWKVEYDITADPDPYLFATFTLTNFTGASQNFTLNAVLPIDPAITGGFFAGGSVSVSLMDVVSGDGVGGSLTCLDTGEPIYMARVDDTDFQPLLASPQSFATVGSATTAFGSADFGEPIPSLYSPGDILNNIEIEINATVGANTVAVVLATFEVTPEPASLGLVATGLGLVVLRRRRAKA